MIRILINQLGYDSEDTKKAILQATNGERPAEDTFTIIEELTEEVVYQGTLIPADPVARWNQGDFYVMRFSDFQPGKGQNFGHFYKIRVRTDAGMAESSPFQIYGNVLEYTTLSSVMYYFKSQRVTGEYEKIDRCLKFKGPREGTVDLHGGWNDATGDIGVHLTHQTVSGFFNVQQGNLAVFTFYKLIELIEQSSWQYYAIFNRRILDEAAYGANWLMRRRAPSGSFFKAGPLRLPDAYELSEVTRKCGFEYKNTIGADRRPIPQEQWAITDESYEASLRGGGGYAVAALAMAARYPYASQEYSSQEYLDAARESFLYLEENNEKYTKDGKWNLMDEYCALEACVELYRTSREFGFMRRARTYADKIIGHYIGKTERSGYLSHDETDRPFFSPAEEGAPVMALLHYAEIEKEAPRRERAIDTAEKVMRFLLEMTNRVSNPFGYAREYTQDKEGRRKEQFFFPHNSDDAPWWQGENARILSLAAAARLLMGVTKDAELAGELQGFADDQVAWVLGLNPYDSCMMINRGRHNPEYFFRYQYDFIGVPCGIVNGITSAFDDDEGIEYIASPLDDPQVDDNWRWAEEWLPHAIWYLHAVGLKKR
ncbi:MAG: glycoside hydrolase [Subdoligranulum sp.]|nr:glycoside hydrolase [Subdoligranulum sp.]